MSDPILEALESGRDYIASALAEERVKFKGHENCSDIPSMESDLAKHDAAIALMRGQSEDAAAVVRSGPFRARRGHYRLIIEAASIFGDGTRLYIAPQDAFSTGLLNADLEFDAANAAFDALDKRWGLGDDRDVRDYDGPEYARVCEASDRRHKAMAAMQQTEKK